MGGKHRGCSPQGGARGGYRPRSTGGCSAPKNPKNAIFFALIGFKVSYVHVSFFFSKTEIFFRFLIFFETCYAHIRLSTRLGQNFFFQYFSDFFEGGLHPPVLPLGGLHPPVPPIFSQFFLKNNFLSSKKCTWVTFLVDYYRGLYRAPSKNTVL